MEGTHYFCPGCTGATVSIMHLVLAQTSRDPLINREPCPCPTCLKITWGARESLALAILRVAACSRLGSQSLSHGFHKEARLWTSETQEALT